MRLFIVAAAAGYTVVMALSGLLRVVPTPVSVSIVHASGLLAIVAVVAWSLLRVPDDEALFSPAPRETAAVPTAISSSVLQPDRMDRPLVAALEQLMTSIGSIDRRGRRSDGWRKCKACPNTAFGG
jgi:hypothetical protein